jgi:hypothetical protein
MQNRLDFDESHLLSIGQSIVASARYPDSVHGSVASGPWKWLWPIVLYIVPHILYIDRKISSQEHPF